MSPVAKPAIGTRAPAPTLPPDSEQPRSRRPPPPLPSQVKKNS
jgi:hypothetical protein